MFDYGQSCPRRFLLAIIALGLAGNAVAATTLWVTNDGVDNSSCGSKAAPCRSISQAIENAQSGDTIVVGAGRYGNISGDGSFSHPGDERAQVLAHINPPFGGSEGCIVCITKPVKILSLHGESVTVIEGVPNSPYSTTVLIASDGVTFGGKDAGFTVTGGNTNGVAILQASLKFSGKSITVAGNTDIGDRVGFSFTGQEFQDLSCPVPEACPPLPMAFTSNDAYDNSIAGFAIELNGLHSQALIVLQGNTARNAGIGFSVQPGAQNERGDAVSAGIVRLLDNVALHNRVGFDANTIGACDQNTAAGNIQAGFQVVPGNASFRGNSAIGNLGPGMIFDFSTDGLDDGITPKTLRPFSGNNFYGNDRSRPSFLIFTANFPGTGLNPGPSAHCGVLNVGAVAATYAPVPDFPPGQAPQQRLDASGNFWGSPNGPSASGSADAAGGACDQNNGITVSKPFDSVAFPIATAPR